MSWCDHKSLDRGKCYYCDQTVVGSAAELPGVPRPSKEDKERLRKSFKFAADCIAYAYERRKAELEKNGANREELEKNRDAHSAAIGDITRIAELLLRS